MDTIGASGNAGAVLSQNQYTVTPQWVRYGAHTVSDEVFEKLTAIRGAFRTRIAYVVQKNGGSQPYEVRAQLTMMVTINLSWLEVLNR